MSDQPPLVFRPVLGSLRPASDAAIDAVKALSGLVTITIRKANRNTLRHKYYWKLLTVAAEVLQDKTDSPWDAESLHDHLKKRLRLGTPLLNTKGEEVDFKVKSTAFHKMNEAEFARWLDRASNVLSQWTGVPAEDLMREAREREQSQERAA